MEDPILISGTDGVGTKLVLAQLLDRHETVGQDLVAMCVNDILASGAEPLFVPRLRGHRPHRGRAHGQDRQGRGRRPASLRAARSWAARWAEHPGVMRPDDYDLAGFTVGVVDRPKMLDPANVRPGDVILGLPSSGRALQRLLARAQGYRGRRHRAGHARGRGPSALSWRRRGTSSPA